MYILLVNKINLAIHEDKNHVPYVKGVTERFVSSPDEVYATIAEGNRNRHVAVTSKKSNENVTSVTKFILLLLRYERAQLEKSLSIPNSSEARKLGDSEETERQVVPCRLGWIGEG